MTTQPAPGPSTLPQLLTDLESEADFDLAPDTLSNEEAHAWASGVDHALTLVRAFLDQHPSTTNADVAHELRKRAIDIDRLPTYAHLDADEDPATEPDDEWPAYPFISDEVRRIADKLDGGTGANVHRGCPDPNVPAATCIECRMTEEAELDDPSYVQSVFTPTIPVAD